eukprot:TRINITY_DN48714_c0_g1_i1.p1 TRINITY_DN48714_c0_g1~~TRINITY_DN48714_c0_g1_i1.p1  ORF type:complete len:480 (+),score=107.15 TRINITY_DN48714_c0_g1_i1:133-1572(+)
MGRHDWLPGVFAARWRLRLVVLACALPRLSCVTPFNVVGYVPDYHYTAMNWDNIVQRTTHLVLFSLEPQGDGELKGAERSQPQLRPLHDGSALMQALKKAGKHAPKILLALGGASRSAHFPAMASKKEARRRLVKRLIAVFKEYPVLAGVDLDWETPQNAEHYRDLGKLAADIRKGFEQEQDAGGAPLRKELIVSMTYHPLVGQVSLFAGLQSKTSGKHFIDYFDMCHSIAYSKYDSEKRHSTYEVSEAAIDEWTRLGLPASKLTLGLPFFGLNRKTGDHVGYNQIVDDQPSLLKEPDVDENQQGYWFNGPTLLERKVQMAASKKVAGVMVWELGQDYKWPQQGLLRKVWNTARTVAWVERGGERVPPLEGGWLGANFQLLLDALPAMTDDNVMLILACIIGLFYSVRTVTVGPNAGIRYAADRRAKQTIKKVVRPKAPSADGASAKTAKAASAAAEDDDSDDKKAEGVEAKCDDTKDG